MTKGPIAAVETTDKELADCLRERGTQIFDEWVRRMRIEVPPAKTTDKRFLIDSLPQLLDQLSDALKGRKGQLSSSREVAYKHAEERAELTNFELSDVLSEYKILRQVVFDVLEERTQMPARERDLILNFMQNALSQVVIRFSELHEERINQSRASERKAKDEFVAILSHDLRTPLQSARMAVEVLWREMESIEKKDLASLAMRNLDRIDKMAEDLLDANLLNAGERLRLNVEECELCAIVREAVDSMVSIYGPRFRLEGMPEELRGYWSPTHLARCLENLLSNAVKYGNDADPVTIVVTPAVNAVRIAVHNSGEPIPPTQLQTMFEPYQRHLNTKTGAQKGWGLGLALVAGVVSAHGGKLGAQSDAENGTVFVLELPMDCRSVRSENSQS